MLAELLSNHTHSVDRSLVPAVSVYRTLNVCRARFPDAGATDTGPTTVVEIVVESVAFPVAAPPPLTLTEFTSGEVASPATFTVTTIGG